MKIAVLTSSRADYGIYLPLLKALEHDTDIELSIIAFGTHLSPFHGYTLHNIIKDGFEVRYTIESMQLGDSANAVATAMGVTTLKFADFWQQHKESFDWVFCLGDRYEMFAAVTAGIPYEIKFAHLHGGERTLGAIDNIFRHSITLASSLHFVATDEYAKRVIELTESYKDIHIVGALGLDNIRQMELLSLEAFKQQFNIDLSKPTILTTFHPETVNVAQNKNYAVILSETFLELSEHYQIVITLPNADTEGTAIRKAFLQLPDKSSHRIICVENLGTVGYFSCMKHCQFLLGNTSSGIIEAASFNKWVINLGDRQKGRLAGNNVLHTAIDKRQILKNIERILSSADLAIENPYDHGGAVDKIIHVLNTKLNFNL